ncbi:MAG TPA: TIGR00730 family Rossman fold protein [Ilumatobacter sp.]|nr:TIGR00730 family Rossman fold protein [Ilumatobacter sp.]
MDTSVPPASHSRPSPTTDELIAGLISGLDARDARLATELLTEAAGLVGDHPAQLDLKIATAALAEMRDAFAVFAPYREVPKVSIFGSARVQSDDPLYQQAHDVAARLAEAGWMVVTGAGPGIMQAGMEGAGRELSIGVSIRLPFEAGANSVIADDDKHVAMKYFFTRKLMLVKESAAFVCLPGGFGTLDETFELLTLTQTGKGLPVPIVLVDAPGDPFWAQIDAVVREQLIPRGLVAAHDTALYKIVDSAEAAVAEITRFYSNYHSIRMVGAEMVVRMRRGPDGAQLADLNARFGHLATNGRIRRAEPYSVEVRHADQLDLERIAFGFPGRGYAELRALIDTLNTY